MSEPLPGNLRKTRTYIRETYWVRFGSICITTSDSDSSSPPIIGIDPDSVPNDSGYESVPDSRSANSLQYGARVQASRQVVDAILNM